MDGNNQDTMTEEINYAAKYGVDYWSFCSYPLGCADYHPADADCPKIQCCADNVGLSYAFNNYLSNPNRHKVNFTLLLQPGFWFPTGVHGGNETLDQELDRYIGYFKLDSYQKVALAPKLPASCFGPCFD